MTEVIIPAAGLGTRLGEHKDGNPKCLVDLGGLTVLEYQLRILSNIGIPASSVHVVIGTSGDCWTQRAYEYIKEIHEDIVLNFENTRRGPAFTLEIGLRNVTEDSLLILDGDIVLTQERLERIYTHEQESVIASKQAQPEEPGSTVVTDADDNVQRIGKGISYQDESSHIYAGFCKVSGSVLATMHEVVEDETDRDIADILDEVSDKAAIYNQELNCGWVNVNTPADLETARELIYDS